MEWDFTNVDKQQGALALFFTYCMCATTGLDLWVKWDYCMIFLHLNEHHYFHCYSPCTGISVLRGIFEFHFVWKGRYWMRRWRDVIGAEHWSLAPSYLCDMNALQAFKWPVTEDMLPNVSLHNRVSLTSDRPGRKCLKTFYLFQACEYVQRHHKLPLDVTENEFERWSHTDGLVNILPIGQTLYLATEPLLRGIARLKVSFLELLTLGSSVGLYQNRPSMVSLVGRPPDWYYLAWDAKSFVLETILWC